MRTLVVADVHLTTHTPRAVSRDLARLFETNRGARIIVAGDLFDRSAECAPTPSVEEVLERHEDVRRALGEHVGLGGELWLCAGNHDAELTDETFRTNLRDALRLDADAHARLKTTPWLLRFGRLHVEHGHLYDPDNVPAHPLAIGSPSLGVTFVKEFIAPTGAFAYLNRNDKLPLELFIEAFTRYGWRGPHVVATYFRAALSCLRRSGARYRPENARSVGDAALPSFAREHCLDERQLYALCNAAPASTMASFGDTFARLYLDRVMATMALLAGAGLLAGNKRKAGVALGALGALGLLTSWSKKKDRYGGRVPELLRDGAALVQRVTDARAVVFGHAHVPEISGAYANPGSFSFPVGSGGRTYVEIEGTYDAPRPVMRRLPILL
ncbi:MAG: metallophosphoesterase [Polyangiaceae bacterium]|nr:metallophosphoesterase [Polyangiaceae bacterium]